MEKCFNTTDWFIWELRKRKSILLVAHCWSLSRVTLCDPLDCSPRGSSVYGILQESIPKRVAIPFSRESSRPRDQTQVSRIAGRFFTVCAARETHLSWSYT